MRKSCLHVGQAFQPDETTSAGTWMATTTTDNTDGTDNTDKKGRITTRPDFIRAIRAIRGCLSCPSVFMILAMAVYPAQATEPRWPEDAALRAVQFVDGNEGWAVGDDGVILHTIDGGKNWEPQVS